MKRRRKSLLLMRREDFWWKNGWHKGPVPGSSNIRRFRTVRAMERVFKGAMYPCEIEAWYYHKKGWVLSWTATKGEIK